jgi:hypothetical protein
LTQAEPIGPAQTSQGRMPPWAGPMALLGVTLLGLAAVLWGWLNPPSIEISYVDAGPVTQFAISEVTAFPEHDFYIVGLEDGRLRALDGRIQASGCTVEWLPRDSRGAPHNPGGRPGVFHDPCSGALWSMLGNAISDTREPMRTPHIDARRPSEGEPVHVYVERISTGPTR